MKLPGLRLCIATSKLIRQWAQRQLPNGKIIHGQILNPKTVNYQTLKPERDGLFCERIFGPINDSLCACGRPPLRGQKFCPHCEVEYISTRVRRYRLGYIQLITGAAHIWFFKAQPNYFSLFLNLSKKKIEHLIYCTQNISRTIFPKEFENFNENSLNFEKRLTLSLHPSLWCARVPQKIVGRGRTVYSRAAVSPPSGGLAAVPYGANGSQPAGRRASWPCTSYGLVRLRQSLRAYREQSLGSAAKGAWGESGALRREASVAHSAPGVDRRAMAVLVNTPDRRSPAPHRGAAAVRRAQSELPWAHPVWGPGEQRAPYGRAQRLLLSKRELRGVKRSEGVEVSRKGTEPKKSLWQNGGLRDSALYFGIPLISKMSSWPPEGRHWFCFLYFVVRPPKRGDSLNKWYPGPPGLVNFWGFQSRLFCYTGIQLIKTWLTQLIQHQYYDGRLLEIQIRLDLLQLERNEPLSDSDFVKKVQLFRRFKYLRSFRYTQINPASMVLSVLPVLPPDLRPILALDNNQIAISDLNKLYQTILFRNRRLSLLSSDPNLNFHCLNSEALQYGQRLLQESVDDLIENGSPRQSLPLRTPLPSNAVADGEQSRDSSAEPFSIDNDSPPKGAGTEDTLEGGLATAPHSALRSRGESRRHIGRGEDAESKNYKSLSDFFKGKKGRFRQNLLGKRVDYSGRSVIVVGPQLKIYECGLPKQIAYELFQPFILRILMLQKKAKTVLGAKKLYKQKASYIWTLIRSIVQSHPILLNRAPTLHRSSIQAFQPRLISGKAILLHPLVCSAFNADFDGDQMGIHLPLCFEARAEAWKIAWSQNSLFSVATSSPVCLPSQDMILGSSFLTIGHSQQFVFQVFRKKLLLKNQISIWGTYNSDFHGLQIRSAVQKLIEIRVNITGNFQKFRLQFYQQYHSSGAELLRKIRSTYNQIQFNQSI